MKSINMDQMPQELNKYGIKARTLADHQNATIKHLFLEKGGNIPNHQVPVDVTFFILEGSGTITISGEPILVKTHDVVLCPPNEVMSVKADAESILSFLNIKTPGLKSLTK